MSTNRSAATAERTTQPVAERAGALWPITADRTARTPGPGGADKTGPVVTVHPIARIIGSRDGWAGRLIAAHVNDGTDHCRSCVRAATGARHTWPCPLHGLATQALDVERERTRRR